MRRKNIYDVVVIGAGSAGFSAAFEARQLGVRVCIVEKGKLGGECPNEACIPSKALLRSAHIHDLARRSSKFGLLDVARPVKLRRIFEYRKKAITAVTGGGEKGKRFLHLARRAGIDIFFGAGTFLDAHTLQVDGGTVEGKTIVVATGSVDFVPPIYGLDKIPFFGWRDIHKMSSLPKSLAVLGGGPVGAEHTTMFALFGVPVVLLQRDDHILTNEDAEVVKWAEQDLKDAGVEILNRSLVIKVDQLHKLIRLKLDVAGIEQVKIADKLLVTAGKRADTDDLNLEQNKVKLTKRGEIITNLQQQTSVSHIFSAGDVDDHHLRLTNTAHHEGVVAGYNAGLKALGKRSGFKKTDLQIVPRVTFMVRELASVGLSQGETQELYGSAIVGRHVLSSLGRSVTDGNEKGFVKLIAHPVSGKILGGSIYAERAGEMIHEVALAVKMGATLKDLASLIHAFPTYSEGISVAAHNVRKE